MSQLTEALKKSAQIRMFMRRMNPTYEKETINIITAFQLGGWDRVNKLVIKRMKESQMKR